MMFAVAGRWAGGSGGGNHQVSDVLQSQIRTKQHSDPNSAHSRIGSLGIDFLAVILKQGLPPSVIS